ncbi:universal stress protein [Algoriphagus sanaruensis]|uniref:Universal stress protein n=1 Tax=Algoriphagus sanaruensis TaxID=1727163 RepID=A0A142ENN7_9BACT|nr:universal stress protein [Algoriphagus sanaruensis]AMQ56742.1 universal stress protein [Algoriphagus sanaruensis]
MIRILVPYDFSESAQNALDFAIGLTKNYPKMEILVLHIIETPLSTGIGAMGGGLDPIPDFESQVFFVELMESRKAQFEKLKKDYASEPFELVTKIEIGNIYRGISENIHKSQIDLVVMGSRGSSGLDEILIGSNTEKVVRTATCPVITIKEKIDVSQLKKVVFASDFKESDQEVAGRFKKMQSMFDAEFYFVYINTPGNFETSRESMNRIRKFVQTHKFEHVKAEIYNSISEEEGILQFAEDIQADMIAITTHGRSGFLHLITGSIAEDVVNHSKRPVWTFKSK